MISADRVNQLRELLPRIESIIILLGPKPSLDHVASALALSRGFQLAQKAVEIAAPNELPEELGFLPDFPSVKQKLGNKNLSISFPYEESSVDKVSYHISDDSSTFYLIIKPKKGGKPLSSDEVEFDYTGADAQLVILVGVHTFESLEHLYSNYQQLFDNASIVTINSFEPEIGQIKLDTSGATSVSEGVARLIQDLELPIDGDVATHLLAGIENTTDGFRSLTTTADTFEMVANLMRAGARRLKKPIGPIAPKTTSPNLVAGRSGQIELENKRQEPGLRPGPMVAQQVGHPPMPPRSMREEFEGPNFNDKVGESDDQIDEDDNNNDETAGDGQSTVFGKALSQKIQSKRNRKKNKKNRGGRPGDLNYQPSGMGPGGGG